MSVPAVAALARLRAKVAIGIALDAADPCSDRLNRRSVADLMLDALLDHLEARRALVMALLTEEKLLAALVKADIGHGVWGSEGRYFEGAEPDDAASILAALETPDE